MGLGECLLIYEQRAEILGKELLQGQASLLQQPFLVVLMSACCREKSKIPQEGCLAVPFSAG